MTQLGIFCYSSYSINGLQVGDPSVLLCKKLTITSTEACGERAEFRGQGHLSPAPSVLYHLHNSRQHYEQPGGNTPAF